MFGEAEEFYNRVFFNINHEDSQMINSRVLNLISGDMFHSYSADFVNDDESVAHPVEVLNTLQLS
jgi:hypothetical protein